MIAAVVCAVGLQGCAGGEGDGAVSVEDTPVQGPRDPEVAPPPQGVEVVADVPDELDVPPPEETASVGCITDQDCLADGPVDLCVGELVCEAYACQPDPSQVVACPASEDPCVLTACNPGTGTCETSYICACAPKPSAIDCDTAWTFSTADAGASATVGSLTCGPDGGEGGEHIWLWHAPRSEVVKVQVDGEAAAVESVHVLGVTDGACAPEACIAGGISGAAFTATAGTGYALVVEHGDVYPALVTLSLACDVTSESDCGDGLDEDQDGWTDCVDTDCAGVDVCTEDGEVDCSDGADDDGDGATDCEDADCAAAPLCMQQCEVALSAGCGFGQGLSTGGGSSMATNYGCGPDAPGQEVVYRFEHGAAVEVTVSLDVPDGSALGLYLLVDQGAGCVAEACVSYGEQSLTFANVPGQIYYLAVDGPDGVAATNFWFEVACLD